MKQDAAVQPPREPGRQWPGISWALRLLAFALLTLGTIALLHQQWSALTGGILCAGCGLAALSRLAGRRRDRRHADAAEATNARLAAIVTSASDAIISFAPDDGHILSWNGGAERLFGYTEREAVGAPVGLLVPPDLPDNGEPTGVFTWVMAGRNVVSYETVRLSKAGERIPITVNATRMLAPDGRVIGVSGIFQDLRPRLRAEAALREANEQLERLVEARTAELVASEARLRESEAGFRLLTEHAGDLVVRVAPDGRTIYASAASRRIVGLTPEALVARGPHGVIHPDDLPAFAARRQHLLAGNDETEPFNVRVLHADRGEVCVEIGARVLRDEATGAPDGFVAVVRDVTARHKAEDERRASDARYRLLADNTSDAITVLDLGLRRTYASPAFRALFGYDPESVIGHAATAVVDPADAALVEAQMRGLVSGEADRTQATYRGRHADGRSIWIEGRFSLVRDAAGQPASIICVLRDVSAREAQAAALQTANRELERLARGLSAARDAAERANRAKSRFLAGMTHELRTPLSGILGYAQILKLEGGLTAAQSARIDSMLSAGAHLLEMINRVLDLSEIESEHAELRRAAVDLDQVARECVDLVRPAAQAKGLEIRLATAAGTPRTLDTDPTRLRQVLLNLLGNAVKFTAAGWVMLRLRTSDAAGMVRIEVADTGPGIPANRRHRLFQDFERLGDPAAVAVEGAGLGLALSSRIAALLGGRLQHEDNDAAGCGSVFWLELPLRRDAAAPGAPADPRAAPQPAAARRLRVLVVDDVAMNRDIAGAFLRRAGHEVVCAPDGAAAVDLAASDDFDAVLMDVRMPGMDGLEATRLIRRLPGPRGRVPVVALTAQAFSEQVAECRAAGMDSHLAKPFTPDTLVAALLHAVAAKQEHAAAV